MIETIHIACASDNKYAVLAATMLKSIEVHSTDCQTFHVWFLDNGISRWRKCRIRKSLDERRMKIHFLRPKEADFSLFKSIPNGRKLTAYHRLLIPQMIAGRVKRILYLDCDILVKSDLSELYKTALQDHEIIAAARDANAWTVGCDWGGGIPNWKDLGMRKDAKYFNSGVLVIDIDKWNVSGISPKVIECNAANLAEVVWLDQYGLNVVLHESWAELPCTWNSYPDKAEEDAKIIHFVSRKPNEVEYTGNFKNDFMEILDQTAWAGLRPRQTRFPGWIPDRVRGRLKWILSPW